MVLASGGWAASLLSRVWSTRGRAGEALTFSWAYFDQAGEEIGRSHRFPDAESAEEWMGTCWPDLAGNGVEEVALFDHSSDRRLYRMGLGAE